MPDNVGVRMAAGAADGKYARVCAALLDDFACQTLADDVFKERFIAAVRGAENEFSRFVWHGWERLNAGEWIALRADVFERDDYTCQYCGDRGTKLECDHIIPISRGGSNSLENLMTACFPCNRSKRDKLLSEWKGRRS